MARRLAVSLAAASVATLACAATEDTVPEQPTAAVAPVGEPWQIVDADPDTVDGIRVLVLHDMEGLSGQDDWKSFNYGRPEYPHGQELLVADVNAVVDGLFAGGATEVHIVDGHGSGNPEPDVRADLAASARRAVENLASAKVMKVSTPIRATLRAVPPASLRSLEGFPGVDYDDNSVSFVTDDLRAAYDGLTAIVAVARTAYPQVMFELLRERPDAAGFFDEYSTRLFDRWLDVESGRWQPPEGPAGTGERRYHGYR